ncbi:MAG: hypothetical protein WAX69_22895 [Victivallales bacterium]
MKPFKKEFIVAEHDLRLHRVVHVSASGQVLHEFHIEYPLDLQMLSGGGILLSANNAIVELDQDFKEIWRYTHPRLGLFSCEKMLNGNVLTGDFAKAEIREIDLNGKTVRFFDFPLASSPQDYLYAFRLLRLKANGNVLIAAHGAKKLLECDWLGRIVHQVDLPGTPYMPLILPDGSTMVSLGSSGLIVQINTKDEIVWQYDMVADSRLERGWIAGISVLHNGNIVYSDSTYDRLVEINAAKELVAIYQDRNILLHPSTHIIME